LLTEAHAKVRECLASHRQALEELAKLLLEKEVVERPQLQAILQEANGALAGLTETIAELNQPQATDGDSA
jgi:hypothetical protein